MFVNILLVQVYIGGMIMSFTTGDALTYHGGHRDESFAMYMPWNTTEGVGRLQFKFRTYSLNGLLLYIDDHKHKIGNGNYMKLKLINGELQLEIQASYPQSINPRQTVVNIQTTTRIAILGNHLNNNQYHYVEIERVDSKTLFTLDGKQTVIEFLSKLPNIHSSVYMGGVPNTPRLFMDPHVTYEARFIGCISKLLYASNDRGITNVSPLAVLEKERGTAKGCINMCLVEQTQTCYNEGGCKNFYVGTGCDCRGTGYSGPTCQEKSESVQFSGSDYLLWRPRADLNSHNSEILLRFKSARASGVLLFVRGFELSNGYVLVELYQNTLYVYSKIKDMKEEVISMGDNNMNETKWRFLKISRSGESISIKLDDGDSVRRYVKEVKVDEKSLPPGFLHISQVFIGGVSQTDEIELSRSKQGFFGCMQDVVINEYDIITLKMGWKETIQTFGSVKDGCNHSIFKEVTVNNEDNYLSANESIYPNGFLTHTKRKRSDAQLVTPHIKRGFAKSNEVDLTWIIVGSCCGVLVLLVVAFISVRCVKVSKEKTRIKYQEQFIRNAELKKGDQEELPLNQKCIRYEIEKPALKTFSPVRRAFYADTDTLQRSSPHDSIQYISPQATVQRVPTFCDTEQRHIHETQHCSREKTFRRRDDVTPNESNDHCKNAHKYYNTQQQRHYEPPHRSVEIMYTRGSPSIYAKQQTSVESVKNGNKTLHRCRKVTQ